MDESQEMGLVDGAIGMGSDEDEVDSDPDGEDISVNGDDLDQLGADLVEGPEFSGHEGDDEQPFM